MVSRWQGQAHPGGGRIQAGIPQRPAPDHPESPAGLLLRGVVVATYESDNENHPSKAVSSDTEPIAIYCDVLTYSSRIGQRTLFFRGCLVSQPTGGMHRGRIWKPRAAQIDKTDPLDTGSLDLNGNVNPANLDGDHVLLGFLDNNVNAPVILRGVPHPSIDEGNTSKPIGNRLRLKKVDGDPDFLKHHGTFYGVADNGDFRVDTRYANDGSLETGAKEPGPPSDGKGSQRFDLPLSAEYVITLNDMTTPETPTAKVTLTLDQTKFHAKFDSGFELLVDDSGTKVSLGGDGEQAVIDTLLQGELGRIKNDVDMLAYNLGKHRHPVPEFPFPLMFGDVIACFKQPSVYLAKSRPPLNLRTGGEVKPDNAPMDMGASEGEYFGAPSTPSPLDLFPGGSDPGATNSNTVYLKE